MLKSIRLNSMTKNEGEERTPEMREKRKEKKAISQFSLSRDSRKMAALTAEHFVALQSLLKVS